MRFKAIIANILISLTIINSVSTAVYAGESIEMETIEESLVGTTVENSNISEEIVDSAVSNVRDLNEQLDELYNKVGDSLNIDYKFVKILHLLAGGKAVYADKKPNIYSDETVTSMNKPFEIEGATTEYRMYNQIECPDENIARPSANYLPDAAYSVAYDIVQLMNERLSYDRGGEQIYFDSLKSSAKKEIIFTEAVMLYTGESTDTVDKYYRVYEKLLYDKQKGENIVVIDGSDITLKGKYLDVFKENGITNETTLKYISIILSFDSQLADNDNSDTLSDSYTLPYIPNYTSRENMMIAATCLTGKVRYVWGGGHSGMSEIDGINPVWFQFEQLYADTATSETVDEATGETVTTINESYNRCIKPSGSWCPLHGYSSGSCSFSDPLIYSLDDYLNQLDSLIDTTELRSDKYTELMESVDFYEGISFDTLNGLDCSGYSSWIYNQITDRYTINTTANGFTQSEGMKEIEFGKELLPGDVFAWPAHIVTIIGRVNSSNKVYVTTESTINVLKFGVVYYRGASQADIEYAKEIARQANQLIGGLYDREEPHAYCMDVCGTSTSEVLDENGDVIEGESTEVRTCHIGRFKDAFVDEDTVVPDYDLPIKDMYAKDIIQYILGKLPYSYILGYNQYEGDLFDKTVVGTNLGVN